MNRCCRVLLISGLLTVLAASAAAETVEGWGEGGIRFALGLPQGEFGDYNDNVGGGFALHVAYVPTPGFAIGLGGTYMMFGSDSHDVDIPLVDDDVELKTDYSAADLYLVAQLRGQLQRLTFYAEGRAGGLYLWAESKLEDDDIFSDDAVGEKVNYDDIALCYGIGGGVMFRIIDRNEGSEVDDGSPGVHIDLKAVYVFGGKAEYLTKGDITLDDNDDPVFDVSSSHTDILHIELGAVLTF
jgi:hypothetical protein